jgi:3-oxoacyl-[acyl-carrier protein] reductase
MADVSTPRTAIVTGAARGIGAATAQRLAADGFQVAVVDLDRGACDGTVGAITAAGGTAIGVAADVSSEPAVAGAVDEVCAELSPPSVLVNNAGIIRDNLLFRMTVEEFDQVLAVHLRGAFLMTKYAQKHMVEARYGRVISLSSTSALGNRGQANYSSAKAGLQGFTKTLAIELGPYGVTVNAVAPGFVVTDMTRETSARIGVDYDEYRTKVAESIPVRRVGQPEDIAHAVSFLASEGAGFVSGQVIYVAGGPRC